MAQAPLRPPGPLPVQVRAFSVCDRRRSPLTSDSLLSHITQPTRVVAGIKHCTVIEQTSYQVRGQRRRSGQPLLRVDFYRSNGRPGIGLSQPKDLRDDKAEVSFVGGKGPKMSYRIRVRQATLTIRYHPCVFSYLFIDDGSSPVDTILLTSRKTLPSAAGRRMGLVACSLTRRW